MAEKVKLTSYRRDIDGLRALSVLAVIGFHFGLLPNGYLGVDVFFVISGYLITGIILFELSEDRFSILNFYLRRIRRIIPLSLFVATVSLMVGFFIMLPDDLENLAQSVVATNLFSNNVLQVLTTGNYWDVANEFKPLMHTWSLGVEEQYYLFYPILFVILGGKLKQWLLPVLSILALLSLGLCFLDFGFSGQFYLIPFRFYELAFGGLLAVILKRRVYHLKYAFLFLFVLLLLFGSFSTYMPSRRVLILITVISTLGILASSSKASKLSGLVLENRAMVSIGLISYSMYMWHQVILSFMRYVFVQHPTAIHFLVVFLLTVLFSVFSYYAVEQPFRKKHIVGTKALLITVALVFCVSTSSALYIYFKGGVFKDIPELDIRKAEAVRNVHAKYNNRIYGFDRPFPENGKINVLVIGNSFARDWANVLLESKYGEDLNISYVVDPLEHDRIDNRLEHADVIFFSEAKKSAVQKLDIDERKLFVTGPKNFGVNSGYFYNYRGDNYFEQKTAMNSGFFERNEVLKKEWGSHYLDLISKVIDENKMVPVFTPTNKFISQDCRHFTKAGAKYYAELFESELQGIFESF